MFLCYEIESRHNILYLRMKPLNIYWALKFQIVLISKKRYMYTCTFIWISQVHDNVIF